MKNQEPEKQKASFVRRVAINLTARALWEAAKSLYEYLTSL
ncbi:hypothetical protein [Streptomyces sp. ML-6]|nr:hypothetical protein [Streptomyces sp. ML-6]MDK0525030.1 hypothetical protein [Streptomyces sp. ML-6]